MSLGLDNLFSLNNYRPYTDRSTRFTYPKSTIDANPPSAIRISLVVGGILIMVTSYGFLLTGRLLLRCCKFILLIVCLSALVPFWPYFCCHALVALLLRSCCGCFALILLILRGKESKSRYGSAHDFVLEDIPYKREVYLFLLNSHRYQT